MIEKRADQLDYVLVDTPGQIEIFTWSASGAIITEAFASTFPTVIAYVVDTPRSANPTTFMSNMLYACSILYKTRLPLVLVFNKTDVAQHEFALEVHFFMLRRKCSVICPFFVLAFAFLCIYFRLVYLQFKIAYSYCIVLP